MHDKEIHERLRIKYERRSLSLAISSDIARALLLYLSFILMSSLLFFIFVSMYESITEDFDRVPRLMYIISSLSLPFSLFSVTRSFELYDKEAQIFRNEEPEGYSLGADIKSTYTSPVLRRKILSKLIITSLFILILPYRVGYTALAGSFVPDLSLPEARLNLIVKAIMLPLAFLFIHLGVFSAHKWLCIGAEDGRRKILATRHCNARLILEQVKILAIYGVCFYFLPSVLLLFISFLSTLALFRGTGLWLFLGVSLALVIIIHYLRALSRRKKFMKKLFCLAKEEGWEISDIYRPYLSVFAVSARRNFSIQKGDKIYDCKFIASVNPRNPTYIDFEGGITAKFTVNFFRFFEVFHYLISADYTFSGDAKKIVILSPEPKRVFINEGRTDIAPDSFDARARAPRGARHSQSFLLKRAVTHRFETGDKIGEYRFFTEAGFISALDNDCIDR